MFRSLPLGRAFGIPLYLNPTFVLLPLYVLVLTLREGWVAVALAMLVLFTIAGCVLLHELGHALAAWLFGIATRDVTLYPIGGVARMDSTGGLPFQEIVIALAGPAVNLLIALLLTPMTALAWSAGLLDDLGGAAAAGQSPFHFFGHYVALVWLGNVVLMAFNMLPAFPTDGGRVLRASLSLGMDRLGATRIAATAGLILALGLAVLGVLLWAPVLVLVALFIAFAGQAELWAMKRQAVARAAAEAAVGDEQQPLPPTDGEAQQQAGGFTGVAWDQRTGTWVRWANGRIVSQYADRP
jgi:Zn-dependent protease